MIHGIDTSFLVAVELIEHPEHANTSAALQRFVAAGDHFALTPQVLDEFIHVVTDGKRLAQPFEMVTARQTAERWWLASDVNRVFPNEAAVDQFFSWVAQFKLGRKRLLDTMLAATYFHNGVTSILSINPSDFTVLGVIDCPNLSPPVQPQGPST
ncbi:MAG: type II toxin-antitoxin system VapC family toxin [Candidatus Saccharimonas sp.]|nr:type II toxin-antitoxin system VapC family toxin [Planctomycetaceae bacterium]